VLTHGEVVFAGPTSEAFEKIAIIKNAGLQPPHVTLLARALHLRPAVNEAGFLSRL
jgi:hypothetical protein